MPVNRVANVLQHHRIPQPPNPPITPAGFCCYPVTWFAGALSPAWTTIYQLALAQAQAVCRPSLPERDLLAYWN